MKDYFRNVRDFSNKPPFLCLCFQAIFSEVAVVLVGGERGSGRGQLCVID